MFRTIALLASVVCLASSIPSTSQASFAFDIAASNNVPEETEPRIVIDAFESGPFEISNESNPETGVAQIPLLFSPDVFGGLRGGRLQAGLISTASVTISDGDGSLRFTVSPENPSLANILVSYGNATPNVDFTTTPSFEVVLSEAPEGGTMTLVASTLSLGSATATLSVSGPGIYEFPQHSFVPDEDVGPDFSMIDRISLVINAARLAGVTFRVEDIAAVPEPSTDLMRALCLGLLCTLKGTARIRAATAAASRRRGGSRAQGLPGLPPRLSRGLVGGAEISGADPHMGAAGRAT